MHNPNEVLMGAGTSSVRDVSNYDGNIEAGLVVRLKSDKSLSVASADGQIVGLSLGKDLSNAAKTAVARKGLGFPVKLVNGFTPTVGAQVAVSDTTGEAKAYTGSGDAYVNAVYASSKITGIGEDGLNKDVALIDFPGGL